MAAFSLRLLLWLLAKAAMNTPDGNSSLLEAIRSKECSMTRCLAEVREKAAAEIEESKEEAQEIIAQGEAEGRERGEHE